jgi:ATP/maltotriose-dependent transcriptional regulator MalT
LAQYFRHTLKQSLNPTALAQLERQTEGWIAGLHLAAMALQQDLEAVTLITAGEASSLTEYLLVSVLKLA